MELYYCRVKTGRMGVPYSAANLLIFIGIEGVQIKMSAVSDPKELFPLYSGVQQIMASRLSMSKTEPKAFEECGK